MIPSTLDFAAEIHYTHMVRIEQSKNSFQVYDDELLLATFRSLQEAEQHVARSENKVSQLGISRAKPALKRTA